MQEKLDNVLGKGYIELCDLRDLEAMMFMFSVPKGEDDIRMVYDGSKSGLNEALWAPWFALPTLDALLRWTAVGSWLGDNDYGEQFLNFPLHPDLQKFCGVDLSRILQETGVEGRMIVGRWVRNAMGLRSSPYNSVQGATRAKILIKGFPASPTNPFQWDRLELNLPCTEGYDATKPWISKWRRDGLRASELVQYVDDVRTVSATEELAWTCSGHVGKTLSFLGLQDAARKRRMSSKRPGAWAGAIVAADGSQVTKSVSKDRWIKTQV